MTKLTDLLKATAAAIASSGATNDPEAYWTGGAAVRTVTVFSDGDDQKGADLECLYLEFIDTLDDGRPDVVWLPEDCLQRAPLLTAKDMRDHFGR